MRNEDPTQDWRPPADWRRITTIDAHTAGEPFRVVTSGVPEVPGKTMLERRRWAQDRLDPLRRALMLEPRGHADMYGCIVTPPATADADLGVLFLHNAGFSTMCGHGIIALATVVFETGMRLAKPGENRLAIDTPAGRVTAFAHVAGRHVERVRFRNVPAFVLDRDRTADVPGIGRVRYDVAFGGAFYAYVDAADLGFGCDPADFRRQIEAGIAIKRAVTATHEIRHPFEDDLGFLYGVVFVGPPESHDAHSRNVCVFADGEVDRSPTGTSVSARLALHHARGEIATGQRIEIESIVGTRFGGRVVERTTCGPYDAVVPEVDGTAHVTGRHEFLIDPADPLRNGFLLR